ncbi:MAG TPA: hypothetical protein VFH01_12875 [Pyrinomonadaceae bacterium]|nr:hypothetical protein [Pyrinomonadaceae bacterium]
MVNKKFQILLIAFLVVTLAVHSLSAHTPAPLKSAGTCGELEQGYGRSKNPPLIYGEPYTVPKLQLRITDERTGVPIGERELIVRYVWRWFEYPYPERPLGVWSDAYDLVMCTTDKGGLVSVAEIKVMPSGWYKGKMLMGRKPEFTHLDVSVHLETHITHFRITKDELERYRRSNADSIPLRVSPA